MLLWLYWTLYNVDKLAKEITERTPFEARATILGHIQRGGKPTARDRVLASTMGVKAVNALIEGGANGGCVCEINNQLVIVPIEKALNDKRNSVLEKYEDFKMLW